MIFQIDLRRTSPENKLPLSYQYELSACIYKVLAKADKEYTDFLHDKGYQYKNKSFKFFSFSNLDCYPYIIDKVDQVIILKKDCSFVISFYVDKAAERFIMGLFQDQKFTLGNQYAKVDFEVGQITSLPMPIFKDKIVLKPTSPIVIGKKNEEGNDDYLPPDHSDFEAIFIQNLIDKYISIHQKVPLEWAEHPIGIKIVEDQKMRSKLVTIKANTKEETKVRGFENFVFELTAPEELIELALLAGVGKMNAEGFGKISEVN
jgi:CRISPR-associated endoribonuclease Cas6